MAIRKHGVGEVISSELAPPEPEEIKTKNEDEEE